jgi:hypothetical protein
LERPVLCCSGEDADCLLPVALPFLPPFGFFPFCNPNRAVVTAISKQIRYSLPLERRDADATFSLSLSLAFLPQDSLKIFAK